MRYMYKLDCFVETYLVVLIKPCLLLIRGDKIYVSRRNRYERKVCQDSRAHSL